MVLRGGGGVAGNSWIYPELFDSIAGQSAVVVSATRDGERPPQAARRPEPPRRSSSPRTAGRRWTRAHALCHSERWRRSGSKHGPQAARAGRRALSSLCRTAVRHGALAHNPVHDTRPIACPRKRVRALTVAEAADLLSRLRADGVAVRLDLPDFMQFLLGTGLRIGEAAAVRESVLDLEAATVHVNAIVVRVNGVGLQIQPRTKTVGSERILALPRSLVDMNRHRLATGHPPGPAGVIFTSPNGMIRDPSNTQADLRQAMDRIGYPWVISHIFPKTVASRLDDEGFSIRHIADQLGHARPSTTLDFYLGRREVTTADVADALQPLVHATAE